MKIGAKDFRRDVQNTRKGYFTLELGGVEIRQCVLHKHDNGKIWFSPPAVSTGKGYIAVVAVADEELKQQIRDRVTEILGPVVNHD